MALPTIYDLSTPTSNLAEFMGLDETFMPSILADNRLMFGADIVPALFAGAHGYKRSHNLWQTLLWGLAGYMAPFPVVAVAAFESATGKTALQRSLNGLEGHGSSSRRKRCIKKGYKNGRRACLKYGSR